MNILTWILGLPVLFGLSYGYLNTALMSMLIIVFTAIMIISIYKGEKQSFSFNITIDSIDNNDRKSGIFGLRSDYKLWGVLGILFITLLSNSYFAAAYVAVSMSALTMLGGVHWQKYIRLAALPILFIFCSLLAILYLLSPEPLGYFDIGLWGRFLSITALSQQMAWQLLSKALCGMTCLYFISLTSSVADIMGALKRANLPDLIIELMYLIYRYIFILLKVQSKMHIAADARLGFGNMKSQWRSFTGIASNLMVLAFRRGAQSFDAMEARGYNGKLEFLEGEKEVFGKKQLAACFCYVLPLFAIIIIEKL